MKVIILCSSVVPNGGTERAISNFVKILKNNPKIEPEIISLFSSEAQKTAFDFPCKITHLNEQLFVSGIVKRLIWYRRVIKRLKGVVSEIKPDVLIGVGHNLSIMLPYIASAATRIYAWEHIEFATIPLINRLIIKSVYPRLSGVIVLTNKAKKEMLGINKNLFLIPNSVPFNADSISTLDNSSLIMVGRMSKEKGYERIIPIAKRLKDELPNTKIMVYGDGSEREHIEQLIKQANLDDYIILKGLDPNIALRYPENDILLMTSYTEVLPMVIIEANSAGLPVIAYTNSGVNATIEDGVNGYIIADNAIDDFVAKLKELLNDNNKLKKISQTARKSTQKYSVSEIGHKWDELIFN